ncbi:MFS transporter [Pseudonocardia nantongensis]|uniref:MFS transporter n=1 Tax=Pseudonocardia nantongensis TaxID=1181885 RepID=UPI00397AEE56
MYPRATSGRGRPADAGRGPGAGLRALARHRDFRAVWCAEVLSVAGDQATRVALTVLVLDRTGSVAGSAAVYALTFLPALLGGLLLGHLADRFPRRTVLVTTDLVRAGLVALMALPGVGLSLICALLVPAVLLGGPHAAARSAVLPDLLPADLLARGIALRQVSTQLAQVAGFGGGGLLVAAVTPTGALLIDAATFAVSALVVRAGLRAACAVGTSGTSGNPARRSWRSRAGAVPSALAVVLRHPRRRYLAAAAWLAGIFVLPEALAAAYAVTIDAGPAATGLLMAADPAGSVVGAAVCAVAVPARYRDRDRWLLPMALGAAVPLTLTPLAPGLWSAAALWAVSGACATACLVLAQSGFALATPTGVRGGATGVAASGLVATQGVAVLLGGLLAQWSEPATALGIAGAAGVVLAFGVSRLGRSGAAAEAAG